MTAIATHFIGPTNTRGSRYKATALGTRHTLTIDADDRVGYHENHDRAAAALIRKQGWVKGPDNRYGDWHRGDGGEAGYIYVMTTDYDRLDVKAEVK